METTRALVNAARVSLRLARTAVGGAALCVAACAAPRGEATDEIFVEPAPGDEPTEVAPPANAAYFPGPSTGRKPLMVMFAGSCLHGLPEAPSAVLYDDGLALSSPEPGITFRSDVGARHAEQLVRLVLDHGFRDLPRHMRFGRAACSLITLVFVRDRDSWTYTSVEGLSVAECALPDEYRRRAREQKNGRGWRREIDQAVPRALEDACSILYSVLPFADHADPKWAGDGIPALEWIFEMKQAVGQSQSRPVPQRKGPLP